MELENISHYKIVRTIGSGGMGEVYLAEDTRLKRKVALKMLPIEAGEDAAKVARFEKEARAASALNHPNILTVYDVGEVDSFRYIVTEFVDGQTLRDYFSHGRVPLQKALDIIIDVGKALSAAHDAGIVHRDIKPENIMIRKDGLVKVLDFGLAKLTEPETGENTLEVTAPGMIMGTPKYMSPEQIRGFDVDRTSDIFSLGVVFYEMVAGVAPFNGETVSDIIAAVLKNEPVPLLDYKTEIPPGFQKTINRCLEKDRSRRYQTMTSLIFDLEKLKNRSDPEFRDQTTTLRMEATPSITPTAGAVTNPPTRLQPSNDSMQDRPMESRSGTWIRRRRDILLGALALGLFVTVAYLGMPYLVWSMSFFSKVEPPKSAPMTIKRLTTNGKAVQAAISPDGKYLAYVLQEADKHSLWVRHIPTSKSLEVIPPSTSSYTDLEFSADNNYIYYLKPQMEVSTSEVYEVPVLGGTQRKVVERTTNSYALSPDTRQIVFLRYSPNQNESYLITANTDGINERTITTQKGRGWLNLPAWSPDGTSIALAAGDADKTDSEGLVEIRLDDLRQRPIGTQKWAEITRVSYLADGSGILVVANDTEKTPAQIWHVSYPHGEARRITTNDRDDYTGVSASAVSNELVTIQAIDTTGMWIAERGDTKKARQITLGAGQDGWAGISWTRDGKIVYAAYNDDRYDLWVMDQDGSNQRQLTANAGSNIEPTVSRDGRYVVFASDRSGSFLIWRMDIDGNNPVQLATEPSGRFPECTADSKWVIFQSIVKEEYPVRGTLWKVSIDGSDAKQLTTQNGAQPAISPDGKTVAFVTDEEISVMPVDGGETKRVMEVPKMSLFGNLPFRGLTLRLPFFRWLPDGSGLIFVKSAPDAPGLWKILLNKNAAEKISDFDGAPINFSWSPDGQRLVYPKEGHSSDVVIISNWNGDSHRP